MEIIRRKIKPSTIVEKYEVTANELPSIQISIRKQVGEMDMEVKEISIKGINLQECFYYYEQIKGDS
jgi:hypothetical protein